MLKSQSKVKELTRELRNKTEESDEYKRKMESLKNERRRGEKTITEVINSTTIILTLYGRSLLFSSAEIFKKPLWQTVWTQIRLLL